MPTRDILGPASLDQIFYVVLLWTVGVVGFTQVYDSPLVRLEIVVGTGVVMIWAVWGVQYRLREIQRNRYRER